MYGQLFTQPYRNAATFADERSELFGADIDEITGIGRRRRQKVVVTLWLTVM